MTNSILISAACFRCVVKPVTALPKGNVFNVVALLMAADGTYCVPKSVGVAIDHRHSSTAGTAGIGLALLTIYGEGSVATSVRSRPKRRRSISRLQNPLRKPATPIASLNTMSIKATYYARSRAQSVDVRVSQRERTAITISPLMWSGCASPVTARGIGKNPKAAFGEQLRSRTFGDIEAERKSKSASA